MANAVHIGWLKEGARAWNQRRVDAPFSPNLRDANLARVDLSGYDLSGADLSRVYMPQALLRYADLTGATLSGVDAVAARFEYATMQNASLAGGLLRNARFTAADARGVDCSGADLSGARMRAGLFCGARFGRILMNGARLHGANLGEAEGLFEHVIGHCSGDSFTRLPDGVRQPGFWRRRPPGVRTRDETFCLVREHLQGQVAETVQTAIELSYQCKGQLALLRRGAPMPGDLLLLKALCASIDALADAAKPPGGRHGAPRTATAHALMEMSVAFANAIRRWAGRPFRTAISAEVLLEIARFLETAQAYGQRAAEFRTTLEIAQKTGKDRVLASPEAKAPDPAGDLACL